MEILQNIGLGLFGILFYSLFKSKDYILSKQFVFSKLFYENIKAWVLSSLLIIFTAIIIYVEPTTKDAVKSMLGIDLTASPAGFFILGIGMNVILKKSPTAKKVSPEIT